MYSIIIIAVLHFHKCFHVVDSHEHPAVFAQHYACGKYPRRPMNVQSIPVHIAELHSLVGMYHNLLIHLSGDRHSGYFQFFFFYEQVE